MYVDTEYTDIEISVSETQIVS